MSASIVWASESHILINEVMYDAVGSDTGYEWIELYNPSSVKVELTGWVIEVAGIDWTTVVQFEEGLIVESKGYFLVCEAQVKGCDFYVDKIGMQNGGNATDGVRIANGSEQDTLLYDSPNVNGLLNDKGIIEIDENTAAPVNNPGESLCRTNGDDTQISSEDFTICEELTPGTENKTGFNEVTSIEELKLGNKGVIVGFVVDCTDDQKCVLVDNTGGLKIKNDLEVKLESDKYYKLRLEKKEGIYYLKEILDGSDIEEFDLEYRDLELVVENLYCLVRKEVELIYTDDVHYYFKTVGGEVFRVNKSNADKIDSDWKYEVNGVLDSYSIGANEEYKYEILLREIKELEKIEPNVKLAESGSGILIYSSLAGFIVVLVGGLKVARLFNE